MRSVPGLSLLVMFLAHTSLAGWDEYIPVIQRFYKGREYAVAVAVDRSGSLHGVWVEIEPMDLPGTRRDDPYWWYYNYYYTKLNLQGDPAVERRLLTSTEGKGIEMATSIEFDRQGRAAICHTLWYHDLGLCVVDESGEVVDRMIKPFRRSPFRSLIDGDGRWHLLARPGKTGPTATVRFNMSLQYCVHNRDGRQYELDIPHYFDVAGKRYWVSRRCFVFAPTADGSMLICMQVRSNSKPSDKLVCLKVNREAKTVAGQQVCCIREDAFRRVRNVTLPNLEMIELPDSTLVLSVPFIDDKGEDNVYQLRFSAAGGLLPAAKMEEGHAHGLERLEDRFTPRITAEWRRGQPAGRARDPQRGRRYKDLYIYGFDDEGNLYHYRTEIEH